MPKASTCSDLLLSWYQKSKRDLPWRKTRDPYKIWLSEVILQQTQVITGTEYYKKFLKRFPNLSSLSHASEDLVLKYWAGLGYYSRARNFHKASKILTKEYGGKIPSDYEEFLKLPGVGPYTAAAVQSIAFKSPYPVLDGNVERVITRLFCIEENPRNTKVKKQINEIMREMMGEHCPGDFNQSVMELGALICTPRNPRCLLCPLSKHCKARKNGAETILPNLPKRPSTKKIDRRLYMIKTIHGILFRKRTTGEWHSGLWDFPGSAKAHNSDEKVLNELKDVLGEFKITEQPLSSQVHSITNHKVTSSLYEITTKKSPPKRLKEGWEWISESLLSAQKENFPAPTQKLLATLWENRILRARLSGTGGRSRRS